MTARTSYSHSELVSAYRSLGLCEGDVVYVIAGLWAVAGYAPGDRLLAEGHFQALAEVVCSSGTIVAATSSMNLCNTDVPFDLATTPSFQRGKFSEYVRLLPDARRSFHPFGSYAAVGRQAEFITSEVSLHVYGPETPEARLVELGAKTVNIGIPPNICSTVHHVEQLMGVPYRYTKEFVHPVVREGNVVHEPYYMYVQYDGIGVKRNYNKKLFSEIGSNLGVKTSSIGSGSIHAYRIDDFVRMAERAFSHDIYIWCEELPFRRPYRQ